MPRNLSSSAFMKPFVVLALPGMYLFYKYSQYKRQQQEQNRRRVTERELAHLNHKIDKLLSKLEENEPELATSQEDECVICVNAKATMQTSPCGHRVVCRKCFVKTIQMAVSQRLLPLRCVICRAKILRLKQSLAPASWGVPKPWILPSASNYSMSGQVPNSESLYSMASGSSSISGVSSASSSSAGSSCSGKCGGSRSYLRQPTGSFRKTQAQSMKYHLQEYKEPNRTKGPSSAGKETDRPTRLPPIQEFQREFRLGKERSTSTRIRCAQKIVTQLETTPLINKSNSSSTSTSYFRTPLKPPNVDNDKKKNSREVPVKQRHVKDEKRKDSDRTDNKQSGNEENVEAKEEKHKKNERQERNKNEKRDKSKDDKKELTKAEKKEQKKEAKAEKKNAKKESKNEKKDKKE